MNNQNYSIKDKEKLVSILAYLVIGIIWFFLDTNIQKSPLVKFHTKQAIILILASLFISVILDFLIFIPILGIILTNIAYLFFFVLSLIGMLNAYSSKQKELPLIGQYSSYLKF